jgi:hypothetical protein
MSCGSAPPQQTDEVYSELKLVLFCKTAIPKNISTLIPAPIISRVYGSIAAICVRPEAHAPEKARRSMEYRIAPVICAAAAYTKAPAPTSAKRAMACTVPLWPGSK